MTRIKDKRVNTLFIRYAAHGTPPTVMDEHSNILTPADREAGIRDRYDIVGRHKITIRASIGESVYEANVKVAGNEITVAPSGTLFLAII